MNSESMEVEFLARRLKARRKACHLTLAEVAERIDMSVSFLSDIETGRSCGSMATIAKLAACYQTSIAALCIEADAEETIRQVRIRMLEQGIKEMQEEIERLRDEQT